MASLLTLPIIRNIFPAPHQLSERETSERILDIVSKVKEHTPLSADDRDFLDYSSNVSAGLGRYLFSLIATPADEQSAQAIDTLSRKVLSYEISAEDALNNATSYLSTRPSMTIRESAAVAGLVNAYLSHAQSFQDALNDFRSNHLQKEPTRDELVDLVAYFNYRNLPNPNLKGLTVIQVPISIESDEIPRTIEVRYNAQGRLEIKDGPVAPMDISCSQIISREKITEMKSLYNNLAERSNYNNLALVLEFAQFVSNERKTDPHITLAEAFTAFNPDLVSLHEKYQSGTCGVLAKRFCHELKQTLGVDGQSVGSEITSNWMSLPIPGTEKDAIKWVELSQEVRGADHTDAIVTYQDEDGNHNAIKFACSMGENVPNEIEEFVGNSSESGIDRYFNTRRHATLDHLPNQTIEEGTVAKSFLKGRFKAVMSKKNNILGVDFLRGNFYMNPSWAKSTTGIPLNKDKMPSINLTDLATPDAEGVYYIDGQETIMTHRRALQVMLEKAQSVFEIPQDFESNILALAQIAPEFSDQLYLQPLPLIQKHYEALQSIAKKMKALSEDESQKPLHREVQNLHNNVLKQLIDNNPEQLSEAIAKLMQRLDLELS